VLVTYAGKKILIDGDAETTTDSLCGESEVGLLLDRYASNGLLDVDLWVVGHHGSDNGTSTDLLRQLTPAIAAISAGGRQPQLTFSAWGYGHPRQSAVERLEQIVTGTRPRKTVYVMPGQHQYKDWIVTKAIYCTCWDGSLTFTVDRNAITTGGQN